MNNSDDQAWTAASLLDADFPAPIWKVEGLVPDEGLMLIAGKRKIGKGLQEGDLWRFKNGLSGINGSTACPFWTTCRLTVRVHQKEHCR